MENLIAFPKLGLEFLVNRVAFTVFGKEIYWYALIILAGFLLGMFFCMKSAQKRGVNPDYIFDIAVYGLFFGVICARIYYCIFDRSNIKTFWDIFKIWEGGIAIYGAIIGAVATAYIYSKVKKLNVLEIFDLCSPGLFIGQIIGRWGNFVNCEVFGGETTLPWGMSINGSTPIHPLFLYESLWNLIGFIIVLIFRDKTNKHGTVFFFYILWYSIGRFFLEAMRNTEYILYLGKIPASQITAIIGVILGISGLVFLRKKKTLV